MPSKSLVPAAAVALLFCACNGGGVSSVPAGAASLARANKIQHIVIVVQENRSFNNLFYGFPGARTATYGYNTKGDKITLQPVGLEISWDIEHDLNGFLAACNGNGGYPGTTAG